MEELFADLVVIGSGPAGQKAAVQAAKLGKSTIMVEKYPDPGGSCLHSGTIPSKSLRKAILNLTDFYKKSYYANHRIDHRRISINDLNYCLSQVTEEQIKQLRRQFKKNHIRLIRGAARFENHHRVAVVDRKRHLRHVVTGEKILIATGSKPRNPKNIPFDQEVVLDSTRLLSIDHVPKKMIVLGGGIIGSEYASFFAALGTEVIVVDKKEQMLPYLDREIGMHLQSSLSKIGLKFIGSKDFEAIVRHRASAELKCRDGTSIEAEMLLYALGRVANVDRLRIENVGITVNSTGHIPVNALFQTSVPHIYAVGDVIGGPALASTSMEQGRLAARHAFGAATHHFPNFYPIGIYTIPEISSCGYTEEQLQTLGFCYEIGRAYYYEIAKNTIAGNDGGMFKILFHADTLEILGVHIIGRDATEVIHIGQVAMTYSARIDYFIDQVFNYPTYAEGYRIAALNGLNKVKRKR
ncbi:MAG: Si-specific NAD(P)(+) transhydrogenase [Chlamydiota bacterium]